MYRQSARAGVEAGAGAAAGVGDGKGTHSGGRQTPSRDGVEMTVCGSPAPSSSPTLPEAPPPGRGAKWRRIGSTQVRVMAKLDES